MAEIDPKLVFSGKRVIAVALASAGIGWVGLAVGFTVAPTATFFAYLTAFTFVTSIALGALVLLMTMYVVRASWNVVIRRLNEVLVGVLPALALLFVPLLFGLSKLYVWVEPSESFEGQALELLRHKRAYLNVPAFVVRSAVYFLVWSVPAWMLWRWSLARDRQERVPEPEHGDHARERVLSAVLLPFVSLALTFAAFDWLMSLQPLWGSTLFGVYYFSGGFVGSFGLLSFLAYSAEKSGLIEGLVRPSHYHALGRFMLAFTIFWAYNAFFQAMLIRIANRPEEVEFYHLRLEHGWDVVLFVLVIARFALPFALLLPRSIKFRGDAMAAIGLFIVVGHYVDMFWLVAPAHADHGPWLNLWDLLALCSVLGTTAAFGALLLRGKPVVPVGDPALARSIAYRSVR